MGKQCKSNQCLSQPSVFITEHEILQRVPSNSQSSYQLGVKIGKPEV